MGWVLFGFFFLGLSVLSIGDLMLLEVNFRFG